MVDTRGGGAPLPISMFWGGWPLVPGWLAGWPWLAVCLAGWLAGLAGRPARQLWILVCKTRCKNPVDFIKSDVNPPVDLCVKNAVDFRVDF